MSTNSKKEILKKIYEIFSKGNVEDFDRYVKKDAIEHSPDPLIQSNKKGVEYVKEICLAYRNAFPDMKMETLRIVEEGDKLVAHIKLSGTHKGKIGNLPVTNKRFEAEGFDMVKFEGDKISEHWGVFDNLAIMNQLGLIQEPALSATNGHRR